MSSMSTLNVHNIVEATAKAHHVGNTHWLALELVDASGGLLSIALFNESPEALLESLTVKEPEAA